MDAGWRGVVSTAYPAATDAGCQILQAGGNAVDAAVAAAWALAVCEPSNSGLGGQSIALVRTADGKDAVIEGHSRAPAAVSLDTVAREQQRVGFRATTVPTTPLVLEDLRRRFGRMSLAEVLAPAITLADEGFPITRLHRRQLIWCRQSLTASPSANAMLLKRGELYDIGDLFRQQRLAVTLQRLASHGVEDFYHGQTARLIADDMRANDGLLNEADLQAVAAAAARPALAFDYGGLQLVTVPPPAGGWQVALGLAELLQLKEEEGLDEREHWYALVGEATQRLFRKREELSTGRATLAHDDYLRLVGENVVVNDAATHRRLTSDTEEPGETTHLCTADAEGNIVSLTQSIQSLFGARAACAPCGFLYNNYLVTCPREPHAHQLAGGCVPRSNSAPLLLSFEPDTVEKGRVIAMGAAGSRRATSALLQTISRVVHRGESLARAVDAPRFHVKLSRNAWLERSDETERELPRLAQRFRRIDLRSRHSYAMGCVQAIELAADGSASGVADPRREGTAQVV